MTTTTVEAGALDQLRDLLPPGSTAYTVLRHVSRSGMLRHIDLYVVGCDGPRCVSWLAAQVMDVKTAPDGSIKRYGAGMDMGFDLVYGLSMTLYVSAPLRRKDRDRLNRWRKANPYRGNGGSKYDAAYAINHRWM